MNNFNKSKEHKKLIVCNLVHKSDTKKIIDKENYEEIDNLSNIRNLFNQDNNILLLIIDSQTLFDENIKSLVNSISTIVLYIIIDPYYDKNKLEISKKLISLGYKYHGVIKDKKIAMFVYNISEYKDTPDWLNNKNWANPELWEK